MALGAAMVVAVSCEGAAALGAGGGSADEGGVIACEDEGVLGAEATGGVAGSEAAGAVGAGMEVSEPDVDVLAARSLVTLRSLPADSVARLPECNAWREGLAFGFGVASTSFAFTGLLDFAGEVAAGDSAGVGAAVSVPAWATVVDEVLDALVSTALGVVDATVALRAGAAATTGCEATWRSNA